MRILQINSAQNFGGGERHLLDLIAGLKLRGHEVWTATRATAEWRGRLAADKQFLLPLKNAVDWRSAVKLARIIDAEKIEIVHAHLARDYAIAALAVRLSRRVAAKLVLTRHVLFPVNRLYRFWLPRDAVFIAVSQAVQASLEQRKIVPPSQIRLIHNGVETQRFIEFAEYFDRAAWLEKFGLSRSRRFVGIAGEIVAHKGQLDFVRAAAQIVGKFDAVDFLIAGRDSSADKAHLRILESEIAELNLKNRVHLLGFLPDVAPFLASLEVFVSASHYEPFGLAIVEAMASQLPIVATRSEGASEILRHDETGKIVAVSNPNEMAIAIAELLSNRETREILAERARQIAVEKFDLARMVDETEAIYKSETRT